MLIPFGVFSAGVSSGNGGAGSFDLISTTILGSSAASVTFDVTGLGSTYKHLQVRAVARGNAGVNYTESTVRFNSDTGSNYSAHFLFGNGSSVASSALTSTTGMRDGGVLLPGNGTTGSYGAAIYDFLEPFSTTKYKTLRTFGGRRPSDDTVVNLQSGSWRNTAAVTSISFVNTVGNWDTGSRFSIYGVKG